MDEAGSSHSRKSAWWFYIPMIGLFIAYTFWILGPYFESVVVRDSAVTSWLNVATSPIDGTLEEETPYIAGIVGSNGILAIIRNDRQSSSVVDGAENYLEKIVLRAAEIREYLAELEELDAERSAAKANYADAFRALLDQKILSLQNEIDVAQGELVLRRTIAKRLDKLLAQGNVSQLTSDEAQLAVAESERLLSEHSRDLGNLKSRRDAAKESIFLMEDGNDPNWVGQARIELKLAKKNAALQLHEAQADIALAEVALQRAKEDFLSLTEAEILVPEESIIWNRRAAPGATVVSGEPIAEWLDCSVLMIDVPLSDAEVPLVTPGMTAKIVLEGDNVERTGTVIMSRGSAFTLGENDLAALAKGRGEGIAQALVEFSHERENFEECPVGRAAYVDFPNIGILDVLRARLRI